jgi:DNA helicase HerA-like ATPase
VLSQCNTQAIFRLINNQDIKAIEELVEGISKYDVMQLPTFVPGQAIFTGVGVEMPVRVRVRSS